MADPLIDDFHSARHSKWLDPNPLPLLLSSLLRRELPLPTRTSIPPFLTSSPTSSSPPLSSPFPPSSPLSPPSSPTPPPPPLLLSALVASTSISISLSSYPRDLLPLLDLLLSLANRPNSAPDRQLRAIACECLRELELAHPCLLSDVCGHLWNLSQMERTHAAQNYMLLLASVVLNAAREGSAGSILSSSIPLVPFSLRNSHHGDAVVDVKEVRKVVAFLMERPHLFTPVATMELVAALMGIAETTELRGSVAVLLKTHSLGMNSV